ncbi:DUF2935 domain-containing protein [Clostridium aminobutyricum]|uniref:DUF2935 domain-containing protein n=1 Tax=Clostridium aminobutyricum TaxID=33953 RepID=A0A939D7E9_CLOAM|nr:DUF2935 domain-containing protein [Clostridium aminobutyricum]MBN7772477.1 DUF2935 domain-containing protein [Clostridium aminobutyricum]
MLAAIEYVRRSLELHLFFIRIMKEHSFFLEIGFTPKNSDFIEIADNFRKAFDLVLREAITLSDGIIDPDFLNSGEVITPYTLKAEEVSTYYTGVPINTELTKMEENLSEGTPTNLNMLGQRVHTLNCRVMDLLDELIRFKTRVLRDVITCNMFTVNYPLLIEHILREAKLYNLLIQRLEGKEEMNMEQEGIEQELFWNRIMAEHSLFIRGLLDPTENELIIMANNFGNEFNQLYEESKEAMDQTLPFSQVTNDSLKATIDVRNFNEQGTQGLLNCKVKSIIIPLLGDHVLRESNHYLRLLKTYTK